MAADTSQVGGDRSQGPNLGSENLDFSAQLPEVFVMTHLVYGHCIHKVFDSGKPFFGCHGIVHIGMGKSCPDYNNRGEGGVMK